MRTVQSVTSLKSYDRKTIPLIVPVWCCLNVTVTRDKPSSFSTFVPALDQHPHNGTIIITQRQDVSWHRSQHQLPSFFFSWCCIRQVVPNKVPMLGEAVKVKDFFPKAPVMIFKAEYYREGAFQTDGWCSLVSVYRQVQTDYVQQEQVRMHESLICTCLNSISTH